MTKNEKMLKAKKILKALNKSCEIDYCGLYEDEVLLIIINNL